MSRSKLLETGREQFVIPINKIEIYQNVVDPKKWG